MWPEQCFLKLPLFKDFPPIFIIHPLYTPKNTNLRCQSPKISHAKLLTPAQSWTRRGKNSDFYRLILPQANLLCVCKCKKKNCEKPSSWKNVLAQAKKNSSQLKQKNEGGMRREQWTVWLENVNDGRKIIRKTDAQNDWIVTVAVWIMKMGESNERKTPNTEAEGL